MAFTAVETIALVLITITIVKLLVILVDPRAWMNFSKNIYRNPRAISIVAFILAVIVLNYLLVEITIVQILATAAFVFLLIVIGMAKEIRPLIKTYEAKFKKGNILREYWFYTLIWVVLMIWGLWEIFA